MKKIILSTLIIVIFFYSVPLLAQTEVSGTIANQIWTKSGSPYKVVGDILAAGIEIEPGVTVLFTDDYVFEIAGILTAIGTEQDSIYFTKMDTSSGWQGIFFNNCTPGSELKYCKIDSSINSGIRIINSTISVSNCKIIQNSSLGKGGGINLFGGKLFLKNSSIIDNSINTTSNAYGGGLYISEDETLEGNCLIDNCIIKNNHISCDRRSTDGYSYGGGIYINGNTEINNCYFGENSTYARATGVSGPYGSRRAYGCGGNLYMKGNITVNNSIITYGVSSAYAGNYHGYPHSGGSGVYVGDGKIILNNCTITKNTKQGIECGNGILTILNSILWENTPNQILGNANATYCNIQGGYFGLGNIDQNPLFINESDLTIIDGSFCIDKGNPDIEYYDLHFPPSYGAIQNDIGITGGPAAADWQNNIPYEHSLNSSPSRINFGNVTKNISHTDTLFISNIGNEDIQINSINIIGENSSSFTISNIPDIINASSISELYIDFSAESSESYSAFLEIESDSDKMIIPLSGTGGIPIITISLDSLDFGDVVKNKIKIDSVAITNDGIDDLIISQITCDSSYFYVVEDSINICPGESYSLNIIFHPTIEGTKESILTLKSNASNVDPYLISLSGNCIPQRPKIVTSINSISFWKTITGQFRDSLITISNNGIDELTITAFQIDNDVFSVDRDTLSIPVNNSCDLTMQFSPINKGEEEGTLTILSNDPDNPSYSISLSGTCVIHDTKISASIDSLNFEDVVKDQVKEKSLTISNIGIDTLIISEITTTNSCFEVEIDNVIIPTGENYELKIKFHPTAEGSQEGFLNIYSNAMNIDPYIVNISGNGILLRPKIVTSTNSINFANIVINNYKDSVITISNEGIHDLTISDIQIDNNVFTVDTDTLTIPVNDSYDITIRFSPTKEGSEEGSLTIISNDPDNPSFPISLSGNCVLHDTKISTTINILEFGDVEIDDMKEKSVSISNIGVDTLIISSITVDNSCFEVSTENIIIPTRQNYDLTVQFQPTINGTQEGSLLINSNAYNINPYVISLSGNGVPKSDPASFTYINPPVFEYRKSLQIQLNISNVTVTQVSMFLRINGSTTFEEFAMSFLGDNIWSVNIPESRISERGIEYYFKAFHDQTYTSFPDVDDPSLDPFIGIVSIPGIQFPYKTLSNDYQLISIPVDVPSNKLMDIIEDDLGEYNDIEYRVYDWDALNEKYIEISDLEINLTPGRSIWLITKNNKTIDIDSCHSLSTNDDYIIQLQNGWNLISNPYAFSISWNDILSYNDTTNIQGNALYYYNGKGWSSASNMEPFRGYAIKTLSSGALSIKPQISQSSLTKKNSILDSNWKIQISARNGKYSDNDNFIGTHRNATTGFDIYDMPEPPSPGKYVSLYFDHSDWEIGKGRYTGDFRNVNEEGHIYDFKIETNLNKISKLSFYPRNLPDDYSYAVFTESSLKEYKSPRSISVVNSQSFWLAVGTESFLSETRDEFNRSPEHYYLSQNYPNPFNPTTQIRYSVPKESFVSLKIYDILGCEVSTLVNEIKNQGIYEVNFDARELASGLYFYRIQSADYMSIKKMMLIK